MTCKISPEIIEQIVNFHGHKCPGLAIGIRASEIALRDVGQHSKDEEVVAVVETDMCGVDAIQFLTGCTFGKGNLIFQDYGKIVFSFFNRETDKSVRVKINPEVQIEKENKKIQYDKLMNFSLDKLFIIEQPVVNLPQKARIIDSFICNHCGEKTMETRSRMFSGKKICIPCLTKLS
jgi:formylmethanofuran dehydrogenase subunit E